MNIEDTHTHVYNSTKSPLNHQLCLFDYIIAGGKEYVPPRSNKAQKPRGARVLWLCFAFRPGLCTGVPWQERRTLEWYISTTQSSACCPYMYVYIYTLVTIYTGDYMCVMWFVCWYMLTRAQKLQDVKHWPFKIGQLRFIREEYDDWDDRYDDVDDYFDAGICHRRCGCVSKFAGNC